MAAAGVVFIAVVGATMWWTASDPPGKIKIVGFIESQRQAIKARSVDQHYSGCDAARADGRSSIPMNDPSYRPHMDGDGDGLACEPYRGRLRNR